MAEASLLRAVNAFKAAAEGPERKRKAKAVRNLAKRVLTAPLRALEARIVAAERIATEEVMERHAHVVASMRERAAALRERGIAGILADMEASDAAEA